MNTGLPDTFQLPVDYSDSRFPRQAGASLERPPGDAPRHSRQFRRLASIYFFDAMWDFGLFWGGILEPSADWLPHDFDSGCSRSTSASRARWLSRPGLRPRLAEDMLSTPVRSPNPLRAAAHTRPNRFVRLNIAMRAGRLNTCFTCGRNESENASSPLFAAADVKCANAAGGLRAHKRHAHSDLWSNIVSRLSDAEPATPSS